MKVLVLNAGSSSMKFKLYDMIDKSVIAEGNCQRLGLPESEIKYVSNKKLVLTEHLENHGEALMRMIELLTTGDTKVIESIEEIGAIGHRVSMGGPNYRRSTLVDDAVLEAVNTLSIITPLHNPPQAMCIRECQKIFGKDFPMAIGFDTAFHHSIPEKVYTYAIPHELAEKYGVRRYGFHGLSYQYVVERYDEITGGKAQTEKMVVCHLGGGASATAVKFGKSLDNTFGFGTGEGLVAGSRAGSLDHVAIGYLMEKTGMSYSEIEVLLHKDSGILGISGVSSDEKELEDAAAEGNKRAQLALDVMAHNVTKTIGAYAFEMGGLDTIIFTGGIGENSDIMRELICRGLDGVGIVLDKQANVEHNRTEHEISDKSSKVKIWIIPTNEELVIAQDTFKLVSAL